MFVLGIDIGTSSCKTILVNQSGEILKSHSVSYPLDIPKAGWSEQNPEDWWQAVVASIRTIISGYSTKDIKGIGLSGQMSGLVLLNKQKEVIYPAILWNDGRAQDECQTLDKKVENIMKETGNHPTPGLVAPKILWFQQYEPELWKQVKTILLPKDYIRFKLTGQFITDIADSSLTQLMDVKNRTWNRKLLEVCGIDETYLGDIVEGCDIGGYLSNEASKITGLNSGTAVIGGAGDQPAAAIGLSCIFPTQTLISIGTSGVVLSITDGYNENKEKGLNNCCHALPNRWYQMGVMLSAAGSLQWYRDTCTNNLDFHTLCESTKNIPIGSEDLLFLPYLTGERTPYCDSSIRGAFMGLSRKHSQAHLSRAVLEGIGMGLFQSLKLIQKKDVPITEAIINGSGTKSDVWMQILADIFNINLIQSDNADFASALGAARLALIGCLNVPVNEACKLDKPNKQFYPNSKSRDIYQKKLEYFDAIYPFLKEYSEYKL